MADHPRCSVIIPTYNRVALLRRTLASLAQQSLPANDFEVLVVDDGSSDTTADLVGSYQRRLRLRYYFQPDAGFRAARARNIGLAHARADVTVFIDSGLVLHSGCLAAHVASHASAAGRLAVCGYVYGFNWSNEDAARLEELVDFADPDRGIATLAGRGVCADARERLYARYSDDLSVLPAPWVLFWTCNTSAATAQIRDVGGFDEEFRTWGGEDLDLAYRLHRDGARFVLDRRASAIHSPHAKDAADNTQSARANGRYMARKYGTPITQLLASEYPMAINDLILDRGLPSCADYLATHPPSGRGPAAVTEQPSAEAIP